MFPQKRIMLIFGTRPEAIKMAPLVSEIKKYKEILEPLVVVTAQHREMLDQVLKVFNIAPDYDLDIMEPNQSLTSIVVNAMESLESVLVKEVPDMVLVQGDTSTTFVGALSSFYQRIPVGHIEAGLRTQEKFRPFPEEINRRLTTVITDLHFPPTPEAASNLLRENVAKSSVFISGNTVIDAFLSIAKREFDLNKIGIDAKGRRIVLVTAHRRENFGAPMKNICEAVKALAKKYDDALFVIPMHKNPSVRSTISETLGNIKNIMLMDPLNYEPFVHLMKSSYIILSDSGGVQEEAPSLGKPVLVLREVTERPEAVTAGAVKLVGHNKEKIIEEAEKLLCDPEEYEKMSRIINPYGDGKASERIVKMLLHYFGFVDKKPDEFCVKM